MTTTHEEFKNELLEDPEFRKEYEALKPKYEKISEAALKRAVKDYLQYMQNQGKLYYDQLFTGEAIEVRGKTRRKIQGCRKGTADFLILKDGRIIFLELKSTKGKLRKEQEEFSELIRAQGALHLVVSDIQTLLESRWLK